MRERMTPHLSKAPSQGKNTVLVGYDDPFEAATGIYPQPMGVTYVMKPQGERSSLMKPPKERRRIFILYRGYDLNMRQIAERLGLSEKTVENQIARAMDW